MKRPLPDCIGCRFRRLTGDKAFLGGVAVAKLFADPKTAKALRQAFQRMCPKHVSQLKSLQDLRLLHLAEAILDAYGGTSPYVQG